MKNNLTLRPTLLFSAAGLLLGTAAFLTPLVAGAQDSEMPLTVLHVRLHDRFADFDASNAVVFVEALEQPELKVPLVFPYKPGGITIKRPLYGAVRVSIVGLRAPARPTRVNGAEAPATEPHALADCEGTPLRIVLE